MIYNVYGTQEVERTAARLLDKVAESGSRALLLDDDADYLQGMDKYLWTFSTKTFIPHGFCDENAEYHKVLLSERVDSHTSFSNVDVVFILKKPHLLQSVAEAHFQKCCFICNDAKAHYDAFNRLQNNGDVVNYYVEHNNVWAKQNYNITKT